MRRFLALTLTLALSLGTLPALAADGDAAQAGASVFADVHDSHWALSAINYVTGQGLFTGTGDKQFSPDLPMSRAMLVTVLYRLSGDQSEFNAVFPDVPAGQWYTQAVAWATGLGIAQGYDTGAFGPDDLVTREQLAMMLFRCAHTIATVGAADVQPTEFADAALISPWATAAMKWAVSHGILTGKPGGLADPAGTATRAEVAAVLQRLAPLLVTEEDEAEVEEQTEAEAEEQTEEEAEEQAEEQTED